MYRRPGFLYPKSPVKFGFWPRVRAGLRLVVFLAAVLGAIGIASIVLANLLPDDRSDVSESTGSTTSPTTVIGGVAVPAMSLAGCEDDEECPAEVLIGEDRYRLNVDPRIEVISDNVSDTVFAAGDVGAVDRAYVIEGVDPALLLAGRAGSTFVALTGPVVESAVAEPTIEQIYVICVTITDVSDYERCDELAGPSPPADGATPGDGEPTPDG